MAKINSRRKGKNGELQVAHLFQAAGYKAERGCLIASDGGGYFRRKDEKDDPHIQAYILREDRRFRTQSHKNKLMRLAWERIHPEQKKTKQVPGQMSFFEV